MTAPRTRNPRRAPRRSHLRVWVTVAATVVSFVVGLALGRALEDGPGPGESRTSIRTLRPLPLSPAAVTTVTVRVTTTAP